MKRREHILLFLFFGTLLIIGLFTGYGAWKEKMDGMRAEVVAIANEADLHREFLDRYGDELRAKERWLRENAGRPMASSEAAILLDNLANATAGAHGLVLTDSRLLPPAVDRSYHTARLAATINGSEEAVYQWLAEFHDPMVLRTVETLRIRPDQNDISKVNCEVTLALWYPPTEEEMREARDQIGSVRRPKLIFASYD